MGENCKDDCGGDCSCEQPKITLAQVVENNNIMINVLTETLLAKGVLTEDEIRDKLKEFMGHMAGPMPGAPEEKEAKK